MRAFTYCVPTNVVFGCGQVAQVGSLVKATGCQNVLVVYGGGSVVRSGLLDRVCNDLKAQGVSYDTFGGVVPNPRLSKAREGVAKAIAMKADFILAVGGGSSIDTAKGIAIGLANPDVDIWEYWSHQVDLEKMAPVGVILTIPAAGSETSNGAVLTNEETGIKDGLCVECMRPTFAILDPELMVTVPNYQLACGVTDIMMHTLDRYFNPICDNQMTDAIAEGLLRVVIANGIDIVKNPNNLAAMSEVVWAGSLSHNGLTGLGNNPAFEPHELGHVLSAIYDVPHGASLASVWGSWARHILNDKPERFAQFAKNVWGADSALEGIEKTEAYFRSLGMPTGFLKMTGKLDAEALDALALRCSRNKTITIGTIRALGYDDMYQIYAAANEKE